MSRWTLEELATTHVVRNSILQNACSPRPRVYVDLGKGAHSHIVRLMKSRQKGRKRMMTKVQYLCWRRVIGMKEDLLPMNATIGRRNLGREVTRNWDKIHLNVNLLMHGNWVAPQMDELHFLEEIRNWEHPLWYDIDQFKEMVTLTFLENQKGLFHNLRMPEKRWMIFGLCQETSYFDITLNQESNFTRRERGHSQFHCDTLTSPEHNTYEFGAGATVMEIRTRPLKCAGQATDAVSAEIPR